MKVDGNAVHSAYDPHSEAVRFAETLPQDHEPRIYLLLEPGLDYLSGAVASRFPQARVISVHAVPTQKSVARLPAIAGDSWEPDQGQSLLDFLEARIDDCEASRVKLVEWRPGLLAYGERSVAAAKTVRDFLKRADASERTARTFGKRWIRNGARLCLGAERFWTALPGDTPVVVAAAGPSLEIAVPRIREAHRSGRCFLVAVSSAAEALLARDLVPDLIVATDGGAWAAQHLQEIVRRNLTLAASSAACLPSPCVARGVFAIHDGGALQGLLLDARNAARFSAPQRGTVSATAIDLALSLSRGPLLLAGFDLGVSGGRTHARPNALDRIVEKGENRLGPSESRQWVRYRDARDGAALAVYAAWFRSRLAAYPDRLFSLGKNGQALEALPVLEAAPAVGSRKPRLLAGASTRLDALPLPQRKAALKAFVEEKLQREHDFSGKDPGCFFSSPSVAKDLVQAFLPDDFARILGLHKAGLLESGEIEPLADAAKSDFFELLEEV